jgi:hypothetical protein
MAYNKKSDIEVVEHYLSHCCNINTRNDETLKRHVFYHNDMVKALINIDTETLHKHITQIGSEQCMARYCATYGRKPHPDKKYSPRMERIAKNINLDAVDSDIEFFKNYSKRTDTIDIKPKCVLYSAPKDKYSEHKRIVDNVKNKVSDMLDEECATESDSNLLLKTSEVISQIFADEIHGKLYTITYSQIFYVTDEKQIHEYLTEKYGNYYTIFEIHDSNCHYDSSAYSIECVDKVEHLYPEFREF